MKTNETQPIMSTSTNKSFLQRVRLDLALTTEEFGCCTLYTLNESGSEADLTQQFKKLEAFPLPPLSFFFNHVFYLDGQAGEMKTEGINSETTMMAVLQSSLIKLSPLSMIFIKQACHYYIFLLML